MATTPNIGLDLPVDTANIDTEIYRLLSNLQLLDTTIGALQTLAAGKAPLIHLHELDDVVGLVTALNNKMAATKTFALSDLTDTRNIAGAPAGYILVKQSDGKVEPVSAPSVFGTFLLRIDSAQALTESQKSQAIENIFSGLTPAQKGQAIANIGGGVLSGFRNKIINGDFAVLQRGTYLGAAAGSLRFLADRWSTAAIGSTAEIGVFTIPIADLAAAGGSQNYHRVNVVSAAGAGNYVVVGQRIEGVRTLQGKKATVTFHAKADAAKPVAIELIQSFGTGGAPSAQANIAPQKINLTTAWQKFSLVFDIPSIGGQTIGSGGNDFLGLQYWFDAGSSLNARTGNLGQQSGSFDIAHVSVVEGDATKEDDPFSPRHIQQEWALCQRYYYETSQPAFFGFLNSVEIFRNWYVRHPVKMRAPPTGVVTVSGGTLSAVGTSQDAAQWNVQFANTTDTSFTTSYRMNAEL